MSLETCDEHSAVVVFERSPGTRGQCPVCEEKADLERQVKNQEDRISDLENEVEAFKKETKE